MRPVVLLLSALTVLSVSPLLAQDHLEGFSEWVEQARRDWTMPGLSVAVVDGERIVFAEGFGVREQGKVGSVDADTLFAIGSNTKIFTAAALGTLVGSWHAGDRCSHCTGWAGSLARPSVSPFGNTLTLGPTPHQNQPPFTAT